MYSYNKFVPEKYTSTLGNQNSSCDMGERVFNLEFI